MWAVKQSENFLSVVRSSWIEYFANPHTCGTLCETSVVWLMTLPDLIAIAVQTRLRKAHASKHQWVLSTMAKKG